MAELSALADPAVVDVICITETWLTEAEVHLLDSLSDFVNYNYCRESNIGGGVSILLKKCYKSTQMFFTRTFPSFEYVLLKIQSRSYSFYLACIYRAPKPSPEFAEEFENFVNLLHSFKQKFFIVGDFNCPKIDWNSVSLSPSASQVDESLLNISVLYSLHQAVVQPTREENVLDLIFSSRESVVTSVDILPPLGLSDHYQVSANLNFEREKPEIIIVKDFINLDYHSIAAELCTLEWRKIFNELKDFNSCYNFFSNFIKDLIKLYVPNRKVNSNRPKKLPARLRHLKSKERALFKKFLKTGNLSFKYKSKVTGKTFSKELRKWTAEEESKLVKANNQKRFWSYVRSKNPKQILSSVTLSDGSTEVDPVKIVEVLNDYFTSVYIVDSGNTVPVTSYKLKNPNKLLYSVTFFEEQIFQTLKNLPNKTTCGCDDIPSCFLRRFAMELSEPLSYLFTLSLNSCIIPEDWKVAFITPIFKKGKSNLVSNFRPISLTSTVSKAMEHVVRKQLLQYLNLQGIISPFQFGFLAKRSTTSQLLTCINSWTKNVDRGICVDVVYLDIAKAFDTVSHSKLLFKLSACGVRDPLLSWIADFLKDRKQVVRLGNSLSNTSEITSGVPQGV